MEGHQSSPPYGLQNPGVGYPEKPQGALGPQVSPVPSAPVLDPQHVVPGYEKVTFQEELVNPPYSPEWKGDEPPERERISGIPSLSEEEVRDAALQYVAAHCCYGKETARSMVITDIKMNSVFHYTFQTFGEKRETAWRYVPYTGQPIDGPMNGPAPGPWDIAVLPNSYFASDKKSVEVPHTAFVKTCHECYGSGRISCSSCSGMGTRSCISCSGSGRSSDSSSCTSCSGSGRSRCITCSGTGQVKCTTCDGHGNLKGFVQLNVIWTNHHENYISETSALPKEKILDVTGKFVFEEENNRVWPVTQSGDPNVDEASRYLVQKHSQEFPTEKILKQRHCLRIVPAAEVNYTWKNNSGIFYVYGFENKVYFDKYPQRCCWLCNIL